MYLEHVLGQCEETRLPSERRAAVKAQDAFRIAGILWAFDVWGVGRYRQADEYDTYALRIVDVDPKSAEDLRKVLEELDILSGATLAALQVYYGI